VTLNTGSQAVDYNTATADTLKIATVAGYTIDESDFEQMVINFNGTGAIKWTAASQTTSLSVAGAAGADSLTGGAGNDTLTGNAGADTIVGGGGDDSLTGGDGADTITAGTGDDTLSGGNGADTIIAGSGDDTITLTEDSQSNDDVRITNGGSSDKAIQATTSTSGDDTGADTIIAFDAGASADSIVLVTATGVTNFEHTTDVAFGAGTDSGSASTGIIADYAANVLIFDMNGDGSATTDDVDMAINMSSLVIDGVAVTTAAQYTTALTNIKADIVYDITGTAAANTITGGDGDDSITGGVGADTIAVGTGDNTVTFTTNLDGQSSLLTITHATDTSDDFTATGGTTTDSITSAWAVGSDLIKIGGDLKTSLEASGATALSSSNSNNLNFNAVGIWVILTAQAQLDANNFGDVSDVLANFNIGNGTPANAAANDEILFTMENALGTETGIYYFKDVDGNGEMGVGDIISLLGIVVDAALTATEITVTS